jgi:hypothetical protein
MTCRRCALDQAFGVRQLDDEVAFVLEQTLHDALQGSVIVGD